ncbi:phage tail terminator family protein [Clostridium saccharobutylicum]|uniref:Phage protein n=1 Tax=Clostridium saccharobutylicum DSM 13864 TaxID=1345695 RepID=U5MRY0_CLOSA|nr:hypothetical protein [Clostridium saccharobutylicum]AGX43283.1 hypothetical protein CLSA_c23080 [Clostridium saccharobutylicum DSM 13864]AQR90583.1 hypothetical protein CLOSC_23040 [Clostridium saccharobutylicum]AQS00487.1 hypothetical protein CSACC_23110 [Clostridium saccharobutylicum]AQS14470.1 hypothetical protein CLOSACC_23110 [Clostridium saccharobutylicum]MBA2906291.1 hypothetical protein [Clostridium saccharobutylicum]
MYTVTKLLKDNFPTYDLIIDEEEQGEEITKPTFFITVSNLSSNSFREYQEETDNIDIAYTDAIVKQEDILILKDKLKKIFDLSLLIGKRKLVLGTKTFNKKDDFLTLTIPLNYLNNKADENINPNDSYTKLMEILNLNIKESE